MIKINNKHDVNDIVYFINSNQIFKGQVKRLIIKAIIFDGLEDIKIQYQLKVEGRGMFQEIEEENINKTKKKLIDVISQEC